LSKRSAYLSVLNAILECSFLFIILWDLVTGGCRFYCQHNYYNSNQLHALLL